MVSVAVVAMSVVATTGGGSALSGTSVGESVSVRKADSKKSAKKGDSDAAWNRMGLKLKKKAHRPDPECLTASHGQVREFLLRTPCTSLDRMLFAIDDGAGNTAVISVAWVGFRTTRDMADFKAVIDVQGSGDIHPLGVSLLQMADVVFTGHNYDAEPNGESIAIAEAEAAEGQFEPGLLDALAEVAAQLPRP